MPGYRPALLGSSATLDYKYAYRNRATESVGLVWLGGNWYDPVSGRFVSPDPAGHDENVSLYNFCAGNPVGYHWDPSGRCLDSAIDSVAGVVGPVAAPVANLLDQQVDQYGALVNSLDTQTAWKQPLNYASSAVMLGLSDVSGVLNWAGVTPDSLNALAAMPMMAPEARGLAEFEETTAAIATRSATTLGETTYNVSFGSTGSSILDSLGLQSAKISNIGVTIDPAITGADLANVTAHEGFHVTIAQNFPNFAASSGRLPYIGAFPLYAEEVGAYGYGAISAGQYGQALMAPISAFGSMSAGQTISVLGTGVAAGSLWYYGQH